MAYRSCCVGVMHGPELPESVTVLMERYYSRYLWPHTDEDMKRSILTVAVTEEMSDDLTPHLTGCEDAKQKLAELSRAIFL